MRRKGMLLVSMLLLSLTACGSSEETISTLSIESQGGVRSVIVEDFDQSQYDQDEFKEMVHKLVNAYKEEHGEGKIAMKSCSFNKEGQLVLEMQYASCEDYRTFNGRVLFQGTVEEAAKTYPFDTAFISPSGEEQDLASMLKTNQETSVIIFDEPISVKTPADILYVSDNVEIEGKRQARAKSENDGNNENADSLISEYAYILY